MTGRHARQEQQSTSEPRPAGRRNERSALTDHQVTHLVGHLADLAAAKAPRKAVDVERALGTAKRRAEQRRTRRRASLVAVATVLVAVAIVFLRPVAPSIASPTLYGSIFIVFGVAVMGMWTAEFAARSRRGSPTLDAMGSATEKVLRQADLMAANGRELLDYQAGLGWASAAVQSRAEDCRAAGWFESESALLAFDEALRSQAARIGALGATLTSEVSWLAGRLRSTSPAARRTRAVAVAEVPSILRPPARRQVLDQHSAAAAQCRGLALNVPFILQRDGAPPAALADAGQIAESVDAAMDRVERICLEALRGSRLLLRASDELSRYSTARAIDALPEGRGRRLAARFAIALAAGILPGGLPRVVHARGRIARRPGLRRVHRRRVRRMSSRAAFLATLAPAALGGRTPIVKATWSALAEGLRHTEELSNAA